MRFAWIRQKANRDAPPKKVFTHPLNLLMMAYNIIWWVPIILPFTGVISYDVAADGKFIMVHGDQESRPQIIAVTNWFAELERLTESDK